MTRRRALPIALLLVSACSSTVDPDQQKRITAPIQRDGGSMWITESEARPLVNGIVDKMKEKEKAWNLAWWEASISGKKEDFDKATRLELELRKIFQDRENYKKLKWLKENTPRIKDDLLIRQIMVLYYKHLENQIDPKLQEEITKKGAEIEQLFYTSRATVDGKPLTANDIREVLGKEKNSARRQKVWEASKEIGKLVAPKLVELVKLRNQAVKPLGFASYYDFMLTVNEIEPKVVQETMEELTTETEKEWAKVKASVDARLAKRWGIKPVAMRPWHYEDVFFQEAPKVVDLGLDKYYAKKDPKEVVTETYRDLELEIKDIVARSDLSEKPGKMQHAYAISIDRLGDARVLANVRPNHYWTTTLLHEFAHALHETGYDAYGKTQGAELPWLLRQPSNYITTEAAAMFFEDWTLNPDWLEKYLGVSERDRKRLEKPLKEMLKIKKLAFIRWSMVMVSFERELYRDPTQNLNQLWWDMVEKYQLVKRPEGRDAPDWATKIHFVMAPVYYQNYMIAQVMTSMIKHRFLLDVLRKTNPEARVFVGRADLGAQFLGAIFMMGAKWHWAQMVTTVCGEILTTKYFVDEYVKGIDETEKESPLKDEPATTDGGVKPAPKDDQAPDKAGAKPGDKPAEKK
ncbi:MAG: M2 family metallopeptidase [Deltaproteobacteria bacterium]|nr:M2 family metallopeptidase [Deltaproteobacteria bacterium]